MSCALQRGAMATTLWCGFEVSPTSETKADIDKALDSVGELRAAFRRSDRTLYLERNRARIVGSVLLQLASLSRGIEMAQSLHFADRPDILLRSAEQLRRLKGPELQRFAKEYLAPERAAVLIVEPEAGGTRLATAARVTRASDERSSAQELFARATAEEIAGLAVVPGPSSSRELVLANGLRVLLYRHGSAPIAQIATITRGGVHDSTPPGLSKLVQEDFRGQIASVVDGSWAQMERRDATAVLLSVPAGNLAAGLDLVASRLESVEGDWEWPRWKEAMRELEALAKEWQSEPEVRLEREQLRRLYGEHPRSRLELDIAALARLRERHAEDWVRRTVAPANTTIVVVGELDLDAAEALVRERLSGWRPRTPGTRIAPLPSPAAAAPRQVAIVDRPQASQATLRVVCPLAPTRPDDVAARDVAVALLERRMKSAIRERMGASYGLAVRVDVFRDEMAELRVEGELEAEAVPATVALVSDTLGALAAGDLAVSELQEAKWLVASKTHEAASESASMLQAALERELAGLGVADWQRFPAQLAAVTARELSRVVSPCAGHEQIGVIGPAAALREALAPLAPTTLQVTATAEQAR